MGAWSTRWQSGSWGVCVLALALLGCGESARSGEQASNSGARSGSGSGSGGSSNGGTGSSGAPATGGASGSAVGGASSGSSSGGAAGSGGADPACPTLPIGEEPGIVVTLHGEAVEFRQSIQFYGGRPPTLDISAGTVADGWASIRLFIGPDGPEMMPGVYRSRPGRSYVQVNGDSGTYEASERDAAIFCVSEAATTDGAPVSGTFTATLVNADGSATFPASGTFLGTVVVP